jgi:hypothetical protein
VQVDSAGNTRWLDVNTGGIYGGSPGRGASGAIAFSLNNNLEMKRLDVTDTTKSEEEQNFKKVKIIDNLSFSTSYDLIADSLNLAPISIRARTTVAGVSINMGTILNPYMVDENYNVINKYVWNELRGIKRLGRVTSANLSFGMSFRSKNKQDAARNTNAAVSEEGEEEVSETIGMPPIYDRYADFDVPWDFGFDYSFNYTGASKAYPNGRINQSIGLRGNVTLTEKWRMSMNTNFDIQAGEFSFTTFNVTRDLHCWSMAFNFVPFGYRKSYSFTINAKSSMLKDLKLQKQQSHYDRNF